MNNVAHRTRMAAVMTATRSPLSNRGYAARRTPGQTATAHGSTPKGVPQLRLSGGAPVSTGDPSRVDVTPIAVTAGRSDLRLLSGEGFTLLLRDPKTNSIMKKQYSKPTMTVVRIQHQCTILSGSQVRSVESGDTGIGYDGGGSGPARARSFGGWDDDWDEE